MNKLFKYNIYIRKFRMNFYKITNANYINIK